MNKADIIIELSEIKSNINKARFENLDEIERLKHETANSVDSIIIDLLDEDPEVELTEAKVGCTCQNCSGKICVDNLADALKRGYIITKNIKSPFMITCIEREVGLNE